MPVTFTLIGAVTVGSGGASNITFNSIPGTYTDLLIKYSLRNTLAGTQDNVNITFNGVTSGYSESMVYGNGSSVLPAQRTSQAELQYMYQVSANATGGTFASGDVYIQDYTSSTAKSVNAQTVSENAGSTGIMGITGGNAASVTSAITSINIKGDASANFVQYSTVYLYGIKNS